MTTQELRNEKLTAANSNIKTITNGNYSHEYKFSRIQVIKQLDNKYENKQGNLSFLLAQKVEKTSHLKVEELNKSQEEMLSTLCESIVCSQNKESWDETLESCVKDFNKIEDLDTLREVLDISSEHSLETYPAAILYHSHEK